MFECDGFAKVSACSGFTWAFGCGILKSYPFRKRSKKLGVKICERARLCKFSEVTDTKESATAHVCTPAEVLNVPGAANVRTGVRP